MKKVAIPYQIEANTLTMPPVTWPARCPCCGEPQTGADYKMDFKAQFQSNDVGTTTRSTYYPLSWQVPMCATCQKHVKAQENLLMIIVVVGLLLTIFIPMIFGFISDTFRVFGVLAGAILAGVITYQLVLRFSIRPKMTSTCTDLKSPVYGADGPSCVEFHFHNETIADEFALLNGSDAVIVEKTKAKRKK